VLTEKDKRYFKKCLTQMLNESLGKVQGTLAHVSDLEDRPSDKADQASIASDVGFAFRIRDREEKLIEKIIEALEKLDVGTFGICEACGEEIPLKRLMARPMTTLCIECKKEQEAQERRRAMNYQSVDY
jgi:DnaK suppressor protein